MLLHLYGTKKDRIAHQKDIQAAKDANEKDKAAAELQLKNLELTAEKVALDSAAAVRAEMAAELRQCREDLREMRDRHEAARAAWDAERRELVAAVHHFEKQAVLAQARVDHLEARISDLSGKA